MKVICSVTWSSTLTREFIQDHVQNLCRHFSEEVVVAGGALAAGRHGSGRPEPVRSPLVTTFVCPDVLPSIPGGFPHHSCQRVIACFQKYKIIYIRRI